MDAPTATTRTLTMTLADISMENLPSCSAARWMIVAIKAVSNDATRIGSDISQSHWCPLPAVRGAKVIGPLVAQQGWERRALERQTNQGRLDVIKRSANERWALAQLRQQYKDDPVELARQERLFKNGRHSLGGG